MDPLHGGREQPSSVKSMLISLLIGGVLYTIGESEGSSFLVTFGSLVMMACVVSLWIRFCGPWFGLLLLAGLVWFVTR